MLPEAITNELDYIDGQLSRIHASVKDVGLADADSTGKEADFAALKTQIDVIQAGEGDSNAVMKDRIQALKIGINTLKSAINATGLHLPDGGRILNSLYFLEVRSDALTKFFVTPE